MRVNCYVQKPGPQSMPLSTEEWKLNSKRIEKLKQAVSCNRYCFWIWSALKKKNAMGSSEKHLCCDLTATVVQKESKALNSEAARKP